MRAISFMIFLTSYSALACPELGGNYAKCLSQQGNSSSSTDMVIKQVKQNNVMNYNLSYLDESGESIEENYKADGKTYVRTETDEDAQLTIRISTTASCSGTILRTKNVVSMNNEVMMEQNHSISKSGKQLVINVAIRNPEGEALQDTLICE